MVVNFTLTLFSLYQGCVLLTSIKTGPGLSLSFLRASTVLQNRSLPMD